MKKIFIPVAVIIVILAIVAIILSRTTPENPGYHVHENGETHYDSGEVVSAPLESHTHENGEVHYGTD